MKAKTVLCTSVLLIVCLLCGCGAQPSPAKATEADGTVATAASAPTGNETATEALPETQSETRPDMHETELYTQYLQNGGYEKILYEGYDDDPETEYEAEAVLIDIDGDGVRELLLKITNKSFLGVRGYSSVTALLGIQNGEVRQLGLSEYGGGSGGGDYLYFRYDTVTEKHVLVYEAYARDGMFANYFALSFFDVRHTETAGKEYGMDGAENVVYKIEHKLSCSAYYTEGIYAEDAQRVLGETDLCKQEDGFVTAYLYDDDYISEAEYDEMYARFVEPTDPAYQMKPVTMENPIPG